MVINEIFFVIKIFFLFDYLLFPPFTEKIFILPIINNDINKQRRQSFNPKGFTVGKGNPYLLGDGGII